MRRRNIGDLQQITIGNICLKGVIDKISVIDTESTKGTIEEYMFDEYGSTQGFWYPAEEMLDEHAERRKSRSMMPSEYVYKRGKDFKWELYSEDVTTQRKVANSFVVQFNDFKREGRGLYIFSRTKGSGKTMLSCCIANEIIQRYDVSVKFVTVPEYVELCRSKELFSKETVQAILDCSLLILDDIGVETDKQEWIVNAIFRLVDYRNRNMLPTIYTSNYEIECLTGDERTISRIEGNSIPLIMPEVSIRKRKAKEKTSEFLKSVLTDDVGDVFEKE